MKILMEYPLINDNELCDGTRHVIEPREIYSFTINNVELYRLVYEDISFSQRNGSTGELCETILRHDGGSFFKVPLRSSDGYVDFNNRINDGSIVLKPVDLSILNNIYAISCDTPIESIDSITNQIDNSLTQDFLEPFYSDRVYRPVQEQPNHVFYDHVYRPSQEQPNHVFLDHVHRPVQDYSKPLDSVIVRQEEHEILEQTYPEQNITNQTNDTPRKQGLVPLYIDEDGNIYTRDFSAYAIFGVGRQMSTGYYRLTPEQLKIILDNYHVVWFKYNRFNMNTNIDIKFNSEKELNDLLKKFCAKYNCSSSMFKLSLEPKTIYIVIQDSQDDNVYRGKFDKKLLLSGLPAFTYDDGKYKRVDYSSATPYMYLKELTKNLKNGEFIDIASVEPVSDSSYTYEFIGGFRYFPTLVNELSPLDVDTDIKSTLSSALLGHIHSSCRNYNGIYLDDELLHYTFDIKEIKDKKKNKNTDDALKF